MIRDKIFHHNGGMSEIGVGSSVGFEEALIGIKGICKPVVKVT